MQRAGGEAFGMGVAASAPPAGDEPMQIARRRPGGAPVARNPPRAGSQFIRATSRIGQDTPRHDASQAPPDGAFGRESALPGGYGPCLRIIKRASAHRISPVVSLPQQPPRSRQPKGAQRQVRPSGAGAPTDGNRTGPTFSFGLDTPSVPKFSHEHDEGRPKDLDLVPLRPYRPGMKLSRTRISGVLLWGRDAVLVAGSV